MENKSKDCEPLICFALVPGGAISGAPKQNNYAGVFIEGRTLILSSFCHVNVPSVTRGFYSNAGSESGCKRN